MKNTFPRFKSKQGKDDLSFQAPEKVVFALLLSRVCTKIQDNSHLLIQFNLIYPHYGYIVKNVVANVVDVSWVLQKLLKVTR